MNTPIINFINKYRASDTSRLHMPGHKGKSLLGFESWDITEIKGADELYDAEGIIAESEANATALFGTGRTLYSTEGSSQCIRSMLFLALTHRPAGSDPVILAARNVHKAFIYSAALIDFQPEWLWPEEFSSLCSCEITPSMLEDVLKNRACPPAAVYITSPDYLGHVADVKGLAEVCHRYGTRLLVDNAHGAYLKFVTGLESPKADVGDHLRQGKRGSANTLKGGSSEGTSGMAHPIGLGADMCCDSAHKTLPVLTGGAYLHLSENMNQEFGDEAKHAMAMFGSTSPSYLILASLDACNQYLSDGYEQRLADFIKKIDQVKQQLREQGWEILPSDPLRITIHAPSGMSGYELASILREAGGECEYADPDDLVLMLTPENTDADLDVIRKAFEKKEEACSCGQDINRKETGYVQKDNWEEAGYGQNKLLKLAKGPQMISVRQAIWSLHELIPASESEGRICATTTVSCPPAIPIVVSGEIITKEAIDLFAYYKVRMVDVVKQ